MTYFKDKGDHNAHNSGIDPDILLYYSQRFHEFSYFSKLLLLVSSLVLRCVVESSYSELFLPLLVFAWPEASPCRMLSRLACLGAFVPSCQRSPRYDPSKETIWEDLEWRQSFIKGQGRSKHNF